jgi:hypothetical protein
VPPILIDERQVFTFKFWFNGKIQNGMSYRNELFCQLGAFSIQQRSRVYQVGCYLMQQDAASVITCSAASCSLWGSLRSELVKELLANPTDQLLPHLLNFTLQDLSQDGEQNQLH